MESHMQVFAVSCTTFLSRARATDTRKPKRKSSQKKKEAKPQPGGGGPIKMQMNPKFGIIPRAKTAPRASHIRRNSSESAYTHTHTYNLTFSRN